MSFGSDFDDMVRYLVQEPDGTAIFVDDLDDYFQTKFADCWEERL